jgi:hypothetical protein
MDEGVSQVKSESLFGIFQISFKGLTYLLYENGRADLLGPSDKEIN